MQRLVIVEDDRDLNRGLCLALKNEEMDIVSCLDLGQARQALEQAADLLLLDVNLPDGSGLEFLQELRQSSAIPIILLTANDTEMDVVMGLEHGADDYITKPFSLAILRARVHAQLRRAGVESAERESPVVQLGPFRFDFERMLFSRNDVPVELSKTEQKLLRVLVENRGHAVPRATLVDRVWTDGAEFVEENALSVTVKRLRSKLEADPSRPEYLKTVYGIGYTWAVKP